MIRQTLISLAVVAALGNTATVNAQQHTGAPHVSVADSAQKKPEAVKQATAVAAQAGKGTVAKTKKAVADAHQAAARHRIDEAQRRVKQEQQRLEKEQKRLAKASENIDDGGDGVVAYSDTASVVGGGSDAGGGAACSGGKAMDYTNRYDPARFSDMFSWFSYLLSTSFSGFLIALFGILLLFLFLAMPFIALFVILRYIVHRHKDRVRLAEMAIKQGRPLTEGQMDFELRPRSYMWRKGVKNLSVGIGLMMFFYFLGAEPLVGIGALVACMGAGKMFMARSNYGMKRRDDAPADGKFFADGMDGDADDDPSASRDTVIKAAGENEENPQGHSSAAE